jgi:D-alanyl-D-alanine carboxypeptidase (penicillin-binding protein 5/6)
MRRFSIFNLLILSLTLFPVWAAESPSSPPKPPPPPPEVPAKSYILQDFHSGQILAEQNADQRVEPASITKIMTAYVIYKGLRDGKIDLADEVTISEKAWRMEGSRTFVEIGSKVPVADLLLGMVVQSGNDATVALAEHLAGSEDVFVELMNREAAALNMTESSFVNASGMPDPDHYMSAQDIATLVKTVIEEFPEHYLEYSVRSFTYNNIEQHNRNRLLWRDDSVDGVKTGHTSSAGYCLAASAKRDDTRLISVVLGADKLRDRFSATESLLNYGFRFYETQKLYEAKQELAEAEVWKGQADTVSAGLAEALFVTIPRGRYDDLSANVKVDKNIEAPLTEGQPVGKVTVTLDDNVLLESPLVALQQVPQTGWLGRIVDGFLMWFYSFFD